MAGITPCSLSRRFTTVRVMTIDWARPNGSETTFAINLREVTFTGLETVVNVTPTQPLSGDWQVRYARLGFTTMEASETSAGFESNYVLDGLKTKIDASVGLTLAADFLLDARMSYQDRLGGYVSGETGQEVEYDPFLSRVFHIEPSLRRRRLPRLPARGQRLGFGLRDLGNVAQPAVGCVWALRTK